MALDYGGSHNFMRFPNFKLKALSLSYDDGLKTDRRLIDIMLKYGLKGTFNLNSGYMKDDANDKLLSEKDAYDLYTSSGMEVAVHGRYHLPVDKVDPAIALNDLVSDRIALENLFGKVVKGMAYPCGTIDKSSVDLARSCGFTHARTIKMTEKFDLPENWLALNPTTRNSSPKILELAKQFVEVGESKYFWFNEPKFFCSWGHSFDFLSEKDWNTVVEFAKIVSESDGIWFATVGEVCDYVKAYERLEFSADGIYVKNPSAIDVYLNYYGNKKVVVPAGTTVKL